MSNAYRHLESTFARLGTIEEALAVLHWDMSAKMPEGGAEARAEQLAVLKAMHHEMLTRPGLGALLDEAADLPLDDWQRANLREMRREWAHARAVPADLVEALSRAVSACETVWRIARRDSDFAMVAPRLETVLGLVRQVAAAKAAALGVTPYDALLDEYEPGGRSAEIDPLFARLERFLPDFLGRVAERQGSAPKLPAGPFPAERQRALALRLMAMVGFDFRHGRLDESTHPFCGGTPDDVRMTTRWDEADFSTGLMGVLHETGHALYEQGLPRAWRRQPVGRARGMSLHESQSLLIEMQASRSAEFLSFATPLIAEAFGGGPWDARALWRDAVRVSPGFIRVDADEVTYPAHVILRYRLEKALIEGRMEIADLPAAWNGGMKDLLGIVPPDDRRGCLQDIHWFDGAWGYFPTYTLGAMTAAQLWDAARRALPDLGGQVARGDFAGLLGWLRVNIHEKASLLTSQDLLAAATGRPLDAAVFEAHLKQRYLGA